MNDDPSAVLDVLDRREMEERQAAVRALLRHPLMTATEPDPDAFKLVRRHARWLREWFADVAGWSLHVDSGLARLQKRVPGSTDATRPAIAEPSGTPFSRRRYALLCIGLAVLERADAQVTLGQLAERVVALVAEPVMASTGLTFAIASREERADLVAIARLLQKLGVLARVAGDEQDFVNNTTSGDALYDVDRRALAGLLATPRGASLVDAPDFETRLQALEEETAPDSADARRRAVRQSLTRRLLDDPLVYTADLTEEQQAYLTSQRAALVRRVCEATGWVAEIRAEGLALLDPTGEATDLRMPEEGTDGHATLLLAEYLADIVRQHAPVVVSITTLHARMANWARENAAHWRKGTREPGADVHLYTTAIARLEGLGLVRVCSDGVIPRPAVARFDYQPFAVQVPMESPS